MFFYFIGVGEITLKNKDPFSPPIIDPHYLEHPDDVTALIDGSTKKLYFRLNNLITNTFKF